MQSGTESRKSGAGRSAATTRFSGFHACARSLTAGGVRPRNFLRQSRPKGRPKLREGQSPEWAETTGSGRRQPSMARRAKPGTPELKFISRTKSFRRKIAPRNSRRDPSMSTLARMCRESRPIRRSPRQDRMRRYAGLSAKPARGLTTSGPTSGAIQTRYNGH